MTLTITIDLDNAAFADEPLEEVRACLARAANRMEAIWTGPDPQGEHPILDTNGNTVGGWKVSAR